MWVPEGREIPQWERHRWEVFFAQIATSATSSGDAGVLGNFPQELEQELKPEVERVLALLAEKTEWSEALEEEVQRLEQIIKNKDKELAFRDWGIGPPSPLRREFYLN